MRSTVSILIVLCVLLCGCKNPDDQATIWTAESHSLDGTSIATASRVDYGGPGNAGLYKYVYLKRTIYGNPPVEIVTFDQGDVGLPDATRLNLAMKWVTPSYLNVTYNSHAGTLEYQVALCLGVNITVHDISNGSQ